MRLGTVILLILLAVFLIAVWRELDHDTRELIAEVPARACRSAARAVAEVIEEFVDACRHGG